MNSSALTPPSTSLREQRNIKIRAEFRHEFDVNGKRGDVIICMLSKRWFLAEDTIERIVFQRGHYRKNTDPVGTNTVSLVVAKA